ncbi:MAG: MBL fold metallo-hydrolase [bacterium]
MSTTEARLVPLAEGVHAFVGAGGDSNAGAIETPDGLLVIDAQQHVPLARRFRAALAELTPKPLLWLINTHYHLDHTAGNCVFAAEAPVLAHRNCLETFEQILGKEEPLDRPVSDFETQSHLLFGPNIDSLIPEGDPGWDWFRQRLGAPEYDTVTIAPPTHTFEDRFAFHLPGRTVLLEHLGPAHCRNDIIVHLPEDGIVFTADLLFVGRFPWLGDGDIEGWISALDRISKIGADRVVPGHGPPATMKEVGEFRDMLAALRGGVAGALEAGMTEDEAVGSVNIAGFDTLPRYKEWMPWNVRNVYRALRAV